jgi:hypothetical protein
MTEVLLGQTVKLRATVTEDGTAATPAAVVFRVRNPAGTVTTPTPSLVSGVYVASVTLNQVGRWHWRAETTTPDGVAEAAIDVIPSAVLS